MKSYKTRYIAPLAIAGVAALGLVAANSIPAPAAEMAAYGAKKGYGAKKKAMYGSKTYGTMKKASYGATK